MDARELELPDPCGPASTLWQECWEAAGMSTVAAAADLPIAPAHGQARTHLG